MRPGCRAGESTIARPLDTLRPEMLASELQQRLGRLSEELATIRGYL